MLKLKLLLSFVMVSAFTFAQETTLNNLHDFDKAVISGKVSEVVLSGRTHHGPSVRVDGTTNKDIDVKIEAGVLYLTISGSSNPVIEIRNSRLKRIEGPDNMLVSNAKLAGGNGRYVVLSIDNHHHSRSYARNDHHHVDIDIPNIDIDIPDIDINIPDLDIDLDMDEDFNIHIDLDDDFDFDFDFDFNFDFDFDHKDWDKARIELREAGFEVRHEINKAVDEVRVELDKLRKID